MKRKIFNILKYIFTILSIICFAFIISIPVFILTQDRNHNHLFEIPKCGEVIDKKNIRTRYHYEMYLFVKYDNGKIEQENVDVNTWYKHKTHDRICFYKSTGLKEILFLYLLWCIFACVVFGISGSIFGYLKK